MHMGVSLPCLCHHAGNTCTPHLIALCHKRTMHGSPLAGWGVCMELALTFYYSIFGAGVDPDG
eukprot:COSAG02_NODE_12263_length_1572_cov_0.951799_3_plen_62_part_01